MPSMTNPHNKLSSIFKSLHTDKTEIVEDADESVPDEAQKWPLFKALAPKKPATPTALTPVEKHNWLSAEPTPPPQHAGALATNFSDKLAAGLGKMTNSGKPAARKQAKPKKVEPQPKATRAKPPAKKTAAVKIAQEASTPLSDLPPQQPASVLKTAMTPKAPGEPGPAPAIEPTSAPAPLSVAKRPSEPWGAASAKPGPSVPEQAALNPQIKKEIEPPASTTPSVNSLLSLFNLEVPTVAPAPHTPPSPQTGSAPERSPVADTPMPLAAQTDAEPPHLAAEVDAVLPSSEPIEPLPVAPVPPQPVPPQPVPIDTMPVKTTPLTRTPPAAVMKGPSEPTTTLQPPGTLKSLLNKLQAPPASPSVKTPGFLNRLNKK